MMSVVSLVRSKYETCYQNLARGISLAGGLEGLNSRDAVSIKINMCDARTPETGAVTHPDLLDALLRYLRESYPDLRICVVESDATVVFADEFIAWLGYRPILEKWDADWHNLSKDKIIDVPVPNGRHLSTVPVPGILKESYVISLSKLKTNTLSSITCALKNQFGCLPMVQKSQFHSHLAEVIADVNLAMPADFSIVDGIIAQGSARGPSFGVPIQGETVICGQDPVAVDTFCAQLMGFNPRRVDHIRLAAAAGVGQMDFQLVGDPKPDIDFEADKIEMFQFRCAQLISRWRRDRFRKAWRTES